MSNSIYGFILGFGAGVLFRRSVLFVCLGSGLGGGIAFNRCADAFNRLD